MNKAYLKEQIIKLNKSALETVDFNINVYPFKLTLGATNISELGILRDNVEIRDFTQFKRVFTGLENVIALWENAYEYHKTSASAKRLTKTYKVGDYFKACVPNTSERAIFNSNSIDSSFINQIHDETVNLIVNREIKQPDTFKLFIIPSKTDEKWLYITQAVNNYNLDGEFLFCNLTLSTINDALEQSGAAIEQYIQPRPSGGGGYAWPVESNGSVSLDPYKKRDIPINSIQLEVEGLAAFSSLSCYGRPVVRNTNGQTAFNALVEAPRLLLPYEIQTPIPSPVNTKPTFESEYYILPNAYAKLQTKYDDWKELYTSQSRMSAQVQNSYDGMLEVEQDKKEIEKTNPKEQGAFKYLVYDNTWTIDLKQTHNNRTNPLTTPTLAIDKTVNIATLLMFNSFINSKYNSLPLTKEHNVMWNLENIPLIGGFLARLTAGIPIGYKDTRITVANDGMNWLIPAGVIDYMNVRYDKGGAVAVDLNCFKQGSNITNEALYSGINSMGTILKVSLTDRFKITYDKEYIFNTVDLGQKHPKLDADGQDIPELYYKDKKLLIDATCEPAAPNADGFVIDSIKDYTLAQTNIRYSLFSNDFPVWQATYKTKSSFTGNIRDILTMRKLSDIKETNGQIISYPADIVAPQPSGLALYISQLDNWQQDFKLHSCQTESNIATSEWNNAGGYKYKLTGNTKLIKDYRGDPKYTYYEILVNSGYDYLNTLTLGQISLLDYSTTASVFFKDYSYIQINEQIIYLDKLKAAKQIYINSLQIKAGYYRKIRNENKIINGDILIKLYLQYSSSKIYLKAEILISTTRHAVNLTTYSENKELITDCLSSTVFNLKVDIAKLVPKQIKYS